MGVHSGDAHGWDLRWMGAHRWDLGWISAHGWDHSPKLSPGLGHAGSGHPGFPWGPTRPKPDGHGPCAKPRHLLIPNFIEIIRD